MAGCTNGDCTNGQGTYIYPDGSVYAGQWENDKFNGQGTFTYSDGSVYIGQWENSLRNGQGTFTRPSGSKYQGQWKNDKFDGQGIYIYAGGSYYKGQWKNNMRNGPGIYTSASGSKYQGQWKNGKLIGKGILLTSDGNKFVGYFNKDGKLIKGYIPLSEAEGRAKPEAKEKAEIEAIKKAEIEAIRKAEIEAIKKAEIEAIKKAEIEANRKAEIEAIRKAEIEAIRKAEIEAIRKAEIEAIRKAEIEANRKADASLAMAKAEVEEMNEAKHVKKDETKKEVRVEARTQAKQKATPGKKTFSVPNGIKFVYISPGTFKMGSPKAESGRYDNETHHQVTLTQGFYMQTTEVTQGQWRSLMGNNPSFFNGCGDDCPVEQVSWSDAQQFIWRLNQLEGDNKYRLPTEAEWEYACRAGSATAFASGEITALECDNDSNLADVAWFCGNSAKTIHPVALKKPNAWGLYDMHGNVSELCQDWYGEYPPDLVNDPEGPASGIDHSVRGGGWDSYARHCRTACRGAISSGQKIFDVGFRIVKMP
ncbi:MAG: SUMF1/EgtB/PvdO family nonheme iron enzyme [Desulfobulbaceae bacterium]|nr:SUMF1/EgtB/PvdO family nonheme iron enzyme [Desulfobulbaceae bacterium]